MLQQYATNQERIHACYLKSAVHQCRRGRRTDGSRGWWRTSAVDAAHPVLFNYSYTMIPYMYCVYEHYRCFHLQGRKAISTDNRIQFSLQSLCNLELYIFILLTHDNIILSQRIEIMRRVFLRGIALLMFPFTCNKSTIVNKYKSSESSSEYC